jgi:hypothetical protein
MKKPMVCLLTVASFAVTAKINEWATAIHGDKTIVLTNAACRYDAYFPEAQITNKDGKITYACYWSDTKDFYLQSNKKDLMWIPKSNFKINKGIM